MSQPAQNSLAAYRSFVRFVHGSDCLRFDKARLALGDVGASAIACFNGCKKLRELEGYEELPKEIKRMVEEDREREALYPDNCCDLLGVFVSPHSGDGGLATVLLAPRKIEAVAKNYRVPFKELYYFVKIHEYAHAAMCPSLKSAKKRANCNKALDHFLEEALATAAALRFVKGLASYRKIVSFVDAQPAQYRYGLRLAT